jgi:hypothetical protein
MFEDRLRRLVKRQTTETSIVRCKNNLLQHQLWETLMLERGVWLGCFACQVLVVLNNQFCILQGTSLWRRFWSKESVEFAEQLT